MISTLVLLAFEALVGLCIGSFIATATLRFTRAEPAVRGRSHCDGCGVQLSYVQTLPIISFVRSGGSCKVCGGRIDPQHLVGELAGATIVISTLVLAAPLRAMVLSALALTLLAAAMVDARTRKLPDVLTAMIAALGVLGAVSKSRGAVLEGLAAAVASFLILEGLRRSFAAVRGKPGLGFGDVKLISALALWLGLATPWAVVVAAALGLTASRFGRSNDDRIPFGPFIALGAFAVGLLKEAGPWPGLG